MSALSDYLNDANRERGLSARRIAELADPPISFTSVARILRGDTAHPSEESLLSLASVLPVTITRLRELAGARAALSAAVDAEILPANPALRLHLPAAAQATERYLTRAEYAAVREHLDPWQRAVTDLLVTTGLRWGEAAGLHTHRITAGGVRVVEVMDGRNRVIRPAPKGRRVRDVPAPAATLEQLRVDGRGACGVPHETGRCGHPLALTTPRGYALDYGNFSRAWRAACAFAEVDAGGLHTLRHTYASWQVQAGTSMAELARLLGHSSVLVTQRYAHLAAPDHARITAAADWRGAQDGAQSATPRDPA